ncbi:MAG: hemerythrin domain-containing protein [Acidimicrobiia bacterium]|nr:hemerythrin domain-containing protein [Acidimicrobiia bacterium]
MAVPVAAQPDLSFFRAVHRKTRSDLARYVRAVERATELDRATRLRPLARWARGFAHELVHHRVREDEILFPALRDRVPAVACVLADIAVHQDAIDGLLARWPAVAERLADPAAPFEAAKAEAVDLARSLQDHVLRRFDLEDAEILPVLAANFGGAEYDALVARAERHRPGRAFAIPWSVDAVEPGDRRQLLARATPEVRLVWKLHQGRYERLVTAAFSDA